YVFFFFQAEDGIRDRNVTGVQTCALPISPCEQLVEPGRPRCCWHPLEESGVTEEQRAEQRRELATRGSVQARLNVMLSLPPETPDPVYRTPADVIAFAERTAGQVLRRELDTRLAAEARENAALALKA